MKGGSRGEHLLYPRRRRCLKCRQFFGFLVVDRLYDSYACAGLPMPARWPDQNAWSCTRYDPATKARVRKARYDTPDEVPAMRGKAPYHCGNCRGWHIGRPINR